MNAGQSRKKGKKRWKIIAINAHQQKGHLKEKRWGRNREGG
jgi:hypothetical protein